MNTNEQNNLDQSVLKVLEDDRSTTQFWGWKSCLVRIEVGGK